MQNAYILRLLSSFLFFATLAFATASEAENELFASPSPDDSQWIQRAKAAAAKDKLVTQIDFVRLQTDVLFQQALRPGLTGPDVTHRPPGPVAINLLPNMAPIVVNTTNVERSAPGYLEWTGYLEGDPQDVVTFVVKEGSDVMQRDAILVGTIVVGGRTFRLRPAQQGTHAIIEINTSAFPPEGRPRTLYSTPIPYGAEETARIREMALHLASPLTTCRIDVLVVYTTAAKQAKCNVCTPKEATSLSDIETIYLDIREAIQQANTSYARSGIKQRLHLVNDPPPASYEIHYPQANDLSTDLTNIYNAPQAMPGNPIYPLNLAHEWRDHHGADLVSLWETDPASDECGMSNWMLENSPGVVESSPENAYSVVPRSCAVGQFSMAHEFGHLGAAHHDRGYSEAIGNPPYDHFSYGYVLPLPSNGTTEKQPISIMAKPAESCPTDAAANGISCCITNCTRGKGFWSNPERTYHDSVSDFHGVRTGATDTNNHTDNRRILNISAEVLANYRPPLVKSGVCTGGH